VPVVEHRVQLAGLDLLVQERRRAVHRLDLGGEIHAVALGGKALEQEPALVERPAGDPDLPALEVGEALDARIGRHHELADGAGERHEGQHLAVAALARHPQVVVDDRIHGLALERDVGRLAAAETLDLEGEVARLVQAVVPDDVEFPVDGAEREHPDLDRAEILGGRRPGRQRDDERHQTCRDVPCSDHLPLPGIALIRAPASWGAS
jgi:hypothetical protein